ncbi:hypothetical protein PCE1_000993 [Barthelona sp. PCE]
MKLLLALLFVFGLALLTSADETVVTNKCPPLLHSHLVNFTVDPSAVQNIRFTGWRMSLKVDYTDSDQIVAKIFIKNSVIEFQNFVVDVEGDKTLVFDLFEDYYTSNHTCCIPTIHLSLPKGVMFQNFEWNTAWAVPYSTDMYIHNELWSEFSNINAKSMSVKTRLGDFKFDNIITSNLDLSNDNGDNMFTSAFTTKKIQAKSMIGDFQFDNTPFSVWLNLENGDLTVKDITNDFYVSLSLGDVKVQSIATQATFKLENGDFTVSQFTSGFSISSSLGNATFGDNSCPSCALWVTLENGNFNYKNLEVQSVTAKIFQGNFRGNYLTASSGTVTLQNGYFLSDTASIQKFFVEIFMGDMEVRHLMKGSEFSGTSENGDLIIKILEGSVNFKSRFGGAYVAIGSQYSGTFSLYMDDAPDWGSVQLNNYSQSATVTSKTEKSIVGYIKDKNGEGYCSLTGHQSNVILDA